MTATICFFTGAAAGVLLYRFVYTERYRQQELARSETEKETAMQKQLERLIAYSGKEK